MSALYGSRIVLLLISGSAAWSRSFTSFEGMISNAVLDWTGYHGSEETQGTVPVLSVYVPKESGYGFLGIQADLRGEKPVRYRERRIF